jgi:hypothetical protein
VPLFSLKTDPIPAHLAVLEGLIIETVNTKKKTKIPPVPVIQVHLSTFKKSKKQSNFKLSKQINSLLQIRTNKFKWSNLVTFKSKIRVGSKSAPIWTTAKCRMKSLATLIGSSIILKNAGKALKCWLDLKKDNSWKNKSKWNNWKSKQILKPSPIRTPKCK